MGQLYNLANLNVIPYDFERITEFKLDRKLNEHGKLIVCGVINEIDEDSYVESADENTSIVVRLISNNKSSKEIFHGIVVNVEIIAENNVRYLKIEALSKTYLMDINKKSRSFQKEDYTYGDVFSVINEDYDFVEASDDLIKNSKIDKFLVQYNETDWQFLKRLASHFNYTIIEESWYGDIKYSIGYSNSNETITLDEYNYKVKKDLKEYRIRAGKDSQGIKDDNFISYEVVTRAVLSLGNPVYFKGKEFYIYKCENEIVNSELVNRYILKDKKAMKNSKINNDKLIGLSLEGSILDTKKDVVKVSLDIDKGNNKCGERWFPYSTVYSSEDGTGWYCMPENGDSIRLYFPNNVDKNSFVVSSINKESSNSEKRNDPSIKSIGTKYGKEIVMKNDAIEIIGNGNLLMKLMDNGGIEVISNKKIVLDAKESISINGGKSIEISGESGIDLLQSNANIKIKEDIVMKGGKVNIE